ncbi:tetratricopeptide repeat protein [candidate division CSSED10-310 bacterium]|uniref:Tetratricopeptide repeat protein n=1 Tax=candidate division CSSED10-310 bacterium TaxID=2855610 RepID=A0ABV6YYV0_UNCC1
MFSALLAFSTTIYPGILGITTMSLINKQIGKIRIVEHLDAGGMGDIYVGYDELLKRHVAVKTIRGDRRLDASTKARFVREAEILSRLEHPNICRIYDLVESEEIDFLILEFIRGWNLKEGLSRGLSNTRKLEIALDITRVLEVAHTKNIVHRDLKPENVMITEQGRVKILDFGLARASVEEEKTPLLSPDQFSPEQLFATGLYDSTSQTPFVTDEGSGAEFRTALGIITGTPMFMSPEQARGLTATKASDMYSLGLLLQWLFTEKPPYPEPITVTELIRRSRLGQTEPVAGLDTDLSKLITRLKSLPVDLRPTAVDTVQHLTWIKEKPNRRVKYILTLAIILLLIVGTTLSSLGFLKARRAETQARREADTARQTIELLQDFLSAVDPEHEGKNIKVIDLLTNFEPRLSELANRPVVQASLYDTYGRTYNHLGLYEKSYQFLQNALDVRTRVLGENHPDTLLSVKHLATVCRELGHFDQAEKLLLQTIQWQSRHLGKNHVDTLESRYKLATVFREQDQHEKAEKLHRSVLQARVRLLGQDHPDTLTSMHNLACALGDQKKYDQAVSLFQKTYALRKRVLGEDHPRTLRSMHNIAWIKASQGKYEETSQLFHQLLHKHEEIHGPEHAETLNTKCNVAATLFVQGNYAEAERLYREVLDISIRVLGENHHRTISVIKNLSIVLAEQHKYDQVSSLLSHPSLSRATATEQNATKLAALYYELGQMCQSQNKPDLAMEFYAESEKWGHPQAPEAREHLEQHMNPK